jgi:hypothetical protein
MGETHEILLEAAFLSGIELQERLQEDHALNASDIQFSQRKRGPLLRTPDSTVLVAVVGSLGTTLVALISSLLQIARESKASKIVLQAKDGRRIEFPAETPPAKIKDLVICTSLNLI